MYDTFLLREWLDQQDPEYINWNDAFQRRGWTESLIREYYPYMGAFEWALYYCYHSRDISIDFAREYRKEIDLHTRDGEVLCIRGKRI